jgi:hypothetical protein
MPEARQGTLPNKRFHPERAPAQHLRQIDLARRWAVSEQTLANWRWRKKGPPHLKIGGRILYRLADVEQYEAQHLQVNGEARR